MENFRRLGVFTSIGWFVGFIIVLGASLSAQEQSIDWGSIEKAARAYFDYPSTENAHRFYLSLPELKVEGRYRGDSFGKIFYYVADNIYVLERQVSTGDRNAVKLGFRLFNIADGHLGETLNMIMGDLVRSHPRLFLEELRASPNIQWIKQVGYPVTQASLNFEGERPGVHRYELEMRINALESVNNEALVGLRDECIQKIRRFLSTYYPNLTEIILDEAEYIVIFKEAVVNIYNETETAYLVCIRIMELEDLTREDGSFGEPSAKIIRSSGMYEELTAAKTKSSAQMGRLRNPPFSLKDAYSFLEKMHSSASVLCNFAINPTNYFGSFKITITQKNNEFKDAYAKLVAAVPGIDEDVRKNLVDLENIKKRLRQI